MEAIHRYERTLRCVVLVASWGSPINGLHNCSRPEPAKVGAFALVRSVGASRQSK